MRRAALVTLASIAIGLSCVSVARADVQPTVDDMVRNVQLRSVQNVRDLGGLRGSRGFIPHGRFYRSATLVGASDEDRGVLLGRGVTLDIDLRTAIEAAEHGDRLSGDSRFTYRRISVVGAGVRDWFRSIRALYPHVLDEHQNALRDVFKAMAAHDHGAVLYHCTSGKDRTGMVTAILLDLAGVDRATIVRDYAISAHYLGRSPQSSPPEVIESFLDALHKKYDGARAFLVRIGLSDGEIDSLLEKLGQR